MRKIFLFGVGERCVSVMLVVEYRLRPGVLRGLGGSRRLEWPRMPRLRLPKYPEEEYFAHLASIFDKMLRVRGWGCDCIDAFEVVEMCPVRAGGRDTQLRSRLPLVGKQGANSGKSTTFGG